LYQVRKRVSFILGAISDGFAAYPSAGLVLAPDGNFYGTTGGGGTNGNLGTVFQITTNGVLATLISLGPATGSQPFNATLVEGANHIIYGTTTADGAFGGGTIFRVVPPPPVITSITQLSGTVTLVWTAITNATYRVEYATDPTSGSWTTLLPDVTAVADTASLTDNPGGAALRFYRVSLLLP
jgi:uncharacterized repeat protein (TIGR03803 family)